MSALDIQVGGDHYKNFVIQPVEFVEKNNLGFLRGDIIKRVCRFNLPGGKGYQDLEKIIHEVELLKLLYGCQEEPDWDSFLAWCRGENPGYGVEI